eukprot:TRINITY_DN2545_c0_g1_i10.p1 TRINITY_DN2545_c0_g1~~TRINITY_DN2545_c0_g1_i10.p1  ORF type:complete len:111 (+),score=14.12 TRINITY_DN2545_c0_g1_i10:66-398(+)
MCIRDRYQRRVRGVRRWMTLCRSRADRDGGWQPVRLTTSISVSRGQCPDPASQCHDAVPHALGVLDIAGVLLQVAASSSADTAACRMGGGRRLLGRVTPPRCFLRVDSAT